MQLEGTCGADGLRTCDAFTSFRHCVCICVLEEPWPIQTDPGANRSVPRWVARGWERKKDAALARLTANPSEEIHHAYVINMINVGK